MPNDGVIILTGAASGIGRASAEALAGKSRTLALVDVNAEMLGRVVEWSRGAGKSRPPLRVLPAT